MGAPAKPEQKKIDDIGAIGELSLAMQMKELPSVDPKLISSSISAAASRAAKSAANKTASSNDLFQAHNFEINIDLSVPINGKFYLTF